MTARASPGVTILIVVTISRDDQMSYEDDQAINQSPIAADSQLAMVTFINAEALGGTATAPSAPAVRIPGQPAILPREAAVRLAEILTDGLTAVKSALRESRPRTTVQRCNRCCTAATPGL